MARHIPETDFTRIVVIGGGFAGIWTARRLAKRRGVRVTLIDRNNYHTFAPLLYQVASAELEAESIAYPLRGIFRKLGRVSCVLAEVRHIDPHQKNVMTDQGDFSYDYLVVAAGGQTAFFGTPGAEEHAFTLKSLEDAMRLRNHLLCCFEHASVLMREGRLLPDNPLLRIVVVGGGPTGVEYAGALSELIHTPLARDFPEFPQGAEQVTLLDAQESVLPGLPPTLRSYTRNKLEDMGVTVRTGVKVAGVEADGVRLSDGTVIPAATVVWTAGIRGRAPANSGLSAGIDGRIEVLQTLQTEAFSDVFVAGDIARVRDQRIPMVAPAAIQQGQHVAANIQRLLDKQEPRPFRYRDKGSMATIGRSSAVTWLGKLKLSGFLAWLMWLFIHLAYLIGFRNRLVVLVNWAWDYLFAERSVRIILPRKMIPRNGLDSDDEAGC